MKRIILNLLRNPMFYVGDPSSFTNDSDMESETRSQKGEALDRQRFKSFDTIYYIYISKRDIILYTRGRNVITLKSS